MFTNPSLLSMPCISGGHNPHTRPRSEKTATSIILHFAYNLLGFCFRKVLKRLFNKQTSVSSHEVRPVPKALLYGQKTIRFLRQNRPFPSVKHTHRLSEKKWDLIFATVFIKYTFQASMNKSIISFPAKLKHKLSSEL